MSYSAATERWRPLVEKYFPANLVDKALYVIEHESGGNAGILGDNGVAVGLFQIQSDKRFTGRPTTEQLKDPEFNIRYAAQNLGAAQGKWGDWGEGTTFQGQKFGALGNNPYPGGSEMSNSPTSGSTPSYDQAVAQLNGLLMNPPDPTLNDREDYSIWLNSVTALTNVVRTLRPTDTATGLDPAAEAANADFNRKIQQVSADISLGSLSLSQQVANIDRFLGGKEESRARGDLIAKQKDAVTRYGAAPGKTAYSGRDMGGVGELYANILGKGIDDALVNYSGTQYLDVEGDLARYDQQMGVTGQIPGVTDVAGGITVPQASSVYTGGGSALPGQGVGQIDVSGGVNSVPLPAINQPSAAGTIEEPGIAKTPSPGPTAVTPSVGGGVPLGEAAGQIDLGGQTGIAAPIRPWWTIDNANGSNVLVGR